VKVSRCVVYGSSPIVFPAVVSVEFPLIAHKIAERRVVVGVQFSARFQVISKDRIDDWNGRSAFGGEGIGDIGRPPIFRQRA
jgi:hypothetical protein